VGAEVKGRELDPRELTAQESHRSLDVCKRLSEVSDFDRLRAEKNGY
jgi:hypothetical protein